MISTVIGPISQEAIRRPLKALHQAVAQADVVHRASERAIPAAHVALLAPHGRPFWSQELATLCTRIGMAFGIRSTERYRHNEGRTMNWVRLDRGNGANRANHKKLLERRAAPHAAGRTGTFARSSPLIDFSDHSPESAIATNIGEKHE